MRNVFSPTTPAAALSFAAFRTAGAKEVRRSPSRSPATKRRSSLQQKETWTQRPGAWDNRSKAMVVSTSAHDRPEEKVVNVVNIGDAAVLRRGFMQDTASGRRQREGVSPVRARKLRNARPRWS